jgi:hypothetical protein
VSTLSPVIGALCWLAIGAAVAWLRFGAWRLRQDGRAAYWAERRRVKKPRARAPGVGKIGSDCKAADAAGRVRIEENR